MGKQWKQCQTLFWGPIFPSGCEGKLGVALESLQGRRDNLSNGSPSTGHVKGVGRSQAPHLPLASSPQRGTRWSGRWARVGGPGSAQLTSPVAVKSGPRQPPTSQQMLDKLVGWTRGPSQTHQRPLGLCTCYSFGQECPGHPLSQLALRIWCNPHPFRKAWTLAWVPVPFYMLRGLPAPPASNLSSPSPGL